MPSAARACSPRAPNIFRKNSEAPLPTCEKASKPGTAFTYTVTLAILMTRSRSPSSSLYSQYTMLAPQRAAAF